MKISNVLIIIGIILLLVSFGLKSINKNVIEPRTESDNIPRQNFTCRDLVPEKIELFLSGKSPAFHRGVKLNNDIEISGRFCQYNRKVGERTDIFTCEAGYGVNDEIDENSILLRDYWVSYEFKFENNDCVGSREFHIECEVGEYSCYWAYG